MKVNEVICKSFITKSKLPDADYVINPYTGCCHGCAYCYAQYMCRFTNHCGEAWGSFMDVKTDGKFSIPKNIRGKTILIGSVTDPYNPLEKKYEATRNILKKLSTMAIEAKIEILTKSPLILRDLDLIKSIPEISVGISLSTTDETFAKVTEKYAASPKRRIEVIHKLYDNRIPVYVFISPIFPYLSDWRNVVDGVGIKADKFCFENLNLRANYKSDVYKILQEYYPEVFPQFSGLYGNRDMLRSYWENESKEIEKYMTGRSYKLYFFHEEIKKG